MASYKVLNHSHQVRDSCSSHVSHGYSKAQMCLKKILGIISSIPAPLETPEIHDLEVKGSGNNRGVGIDLNLRLGPFLGDTQEQESESLAENGNLSACSFVGKVSETDSVAESTRVVHADTRVVHADRVVAVEKSSEGECDPKEKALEELVAEKALEVSEITNQQRVESCELIDEETKLEEDEEEVKTVAFENNKSSDCDCLGLLVEAAKLISGDFGDNESDSGKKKLSGELETQQDRVVEKRKSSKRKKKNSESVSMVDWLEELEDTSPVVRSKRGRSQVLPTRYRDSVLDPWKPLPRPQKPSTATAVSKKRRN